ncbi:hypothetical protein FA13DRAFT_233331 [Coprinellus micaceus]|uniref:Uncharacterized protein n=1 Tax=Coprinellus micaceus TaxID=71717 RepID=A0A4Y7THG4_COPMI|nr:hypothetical protein FA13DRAFT_233331 [Coprinellus micaceus]
MVRFQAVLQAPKRCPNFRASRSLPEETVQSLTRHRCQNREMRSFNRHSRESIFLRTPLPSSQFPPMRTNLANSISPFPAPSQDVGHHSGHARVTSQVFLDWPSNCELPCLRR